MNILLLGDILGPAGRKALTESLPNLIKQKELDFVVVNGEETDFLQNGNELIIPCDAGTEKIEIYGSWAIPEFGVIAGVILAVAIASIIAVSAKSRLTLIPKN